MSGIDTANIFKKCLPAFSTDVGRTGVVTSCDISPIDEADFANIYKDGSGKFRDLRNMFMAHFHGRVYGNEKFGLWDLIQSLKKPMSVNRIGKKMTDSGIWQIEPFVMMHRKATINREYWTAYYKGTGAGSNIQVWLQSQHSLQPDTGWFAPGMRIHLLSTGGSGDAVNTEWEVAASPAPSVVTDPGAGAADDIPCVLVELVPRNSNSFMPSAKTTLPTVSSGAKLGLVLRGTANVSDYEKYCEQVPAINATQAFPFWLETTRYSIQEDTETTKYLNAIAAGNDYYRTFQHVPSVEVNRQITTDFKRRQVNSMFYNKPLANQDLTNWPSLGQITIPAAASLSLPMESKCIGYRAASVGLFEQMAQCGRLYDLQGNKLSIQEMVNELYNVWRARDTVGLDASVIEIWTDSQYAITLRKAFMQHVLDDAPPSSVTFNYELSKNAVEEGQFGLKFFSFQLARPAIELRIVFSKELDDMLSAHQTAGNADYGRQIWCLDWSAIYQAPLLTNQVVNKSGTAQDAAKVDSDFMCVMETAQKTVRMFSETSTLVFDSPDTSFIFENVGSATPEQGTAGSSTTDMQGV